MRVVGLIVEYNPFHNGHAYHLNKSKEITNADFVIAIMSGNFLQRGTPALIDQWTRTVMALENGVDLVIQLPVYYSTSSAEYFANASIEILNNLGIVDSVCFGSECGNIELLTEISRILVNEPSELKCLIKDYLGKGLSFPKARSKALLDFFKNQNRYTNIDELEKVLDSPNNILGIEYIKALLKSKSSIKPHTITRQVTGYHDISIEKPIASATGIRDFLSNNEEIKPLQKNVPNNTFDIMSRFYNKSFPVFIDDFSEYLFYKLLSCTPTQLQSYLDVSEGLEDRIFKYSKECNKISTLIEKVKTKRFTYTRIQRALIHILLNIKKDDFQVLLNTDLIYYIKYLGFKKESQELLKNIKSNCTLPIISNTNKALGNLTSPALKMLEKDLYATHLYNLCVSQKFNTQLNSDLTQKFIIT
ncbi:putative nucleotidyltransferase [Natranaerovirga pectinivora]|uniref:tRNA(Met) cytidine acetate ligase n=1 Tax=Natranaerovirga pectinivora TaxID=682400 RepID=A0A4R3MQ22_9FIRM|nr:nucleotidyltransferase [Natranaerovirga pectinivora]TCT16962.1 putative nucleotidyltransferase [Natranaerovirga pectinivora]